MTWRTGTRNPHALYYDAGGVSIPHGFLTHPEVAKRIVEAMNGPAPGENATGSSDRELLSEARDELRLSLRQLHGMTERDATADGRRLDQLIMAIEQRLREVT